ncbi:2,5-furandicarboxylate decarboxylase 1 [Oscillibacter sp. PC13]|uniref:UbiD family decarboxylase n=1 Tax=Oscillibacter sp. PC13 TaxID=1855299 RepID=UPI0008E918E0|nr:UbiD family decarboxylase [Oscillibacter sp. PC13]SFO98524.1 2,5-furandicarboxylate decarboxylase 1 [Oscillibacter sp. PC13]
MKPILREWLAKMEQDGMMKRISREVDPINELAAVGKKLEPQYGALFEHVRGSSMPVVTGVITSRDGMAKSMGMSYEELLQDFNHALSNPTPCKVLEKEQGPFAIKENILTGDQVDLGILPACLHHEKDSSRYLTAALCIAKDPETGIRNVCIHRHEIKDRNHLGALLLPRHTNQMFSKAEAMGKPLEIALAIGVHPSLLLASQATTALGVDEFEIAGSLLGEPVELVKCETVDLEVPVESEIIIEGKILPNVREEEGPFGEYPKTYGAKAPRHVIEITAITYRNNPIYHTIIPATMEHLLLGGISREATMMQVIRQATPNVKKVHITPASGCRYHVVIQLDQKHEGEAKNAMFAAFTSSTEVKHVVVVDTDIDIYDMQDVEWAISNRVQAARDVFIIPNAMGNKLDPSSRGGASDKMGIDATIPMSDKRERFQKIHIAGYEDINLKDYL